MEIGNFRASTAESACGRVAVDFARSAVDAFFSAQYPRFRNLLVHPPLLRIHPCRDLARALASAYAKMDVSI
jgi:hypothetical protein